MDTIKAFTVHEVHDEHFTYWIVPLHDHELVNNEKLAMQLFHSKEEAERFAAEHRGKQNQ
jgi:hypothetical protein